MEEVKLALQQAQQEMKNSELAHQAVVSQMKTLSDYQKELEEVRRRYIQPQVAQPQVAQPQAAQPQTLVPNQLPSTPSQDQRNGIYWLNPFE